MPTTMCSASGKRSPDARIDIDGRYIPSSLSDGESSKSAPSTARRNSRQHPHPSAEYIKGKYDAIVQAHPGFAPLTTVRKEYLEAAFQTIDTDYQGMDNYLKNQLGVDTHRLRMLYTE